MPKPGRLYICLDVAFFDEQAHVSDTGLLLFLEMLTRAKQIHAVGVLSRAQIERCAPRHFGALPELVSAGLVANENEADSFCFPSWSAWNSEAEAKQKAGRKGGIASGIARRAAKQTEAEPKVLLEHSREEKSRDREEKTKASPPPVADPLRGWPEFWGIYPKRNGKRLGAGVCKALWAKLPIEDRLAAYRGAVNYALACDGGLTIAKDPERWLRGQCWVDWQEPASGPSTNGHAAEAPRPYDHSVHMPPAVEPTEYGRQAIKQLREQVKGVADAHRV